MKTRLSIIMPNYNHGVYLEERISSILSQLADDDELVIVDDASTDNSLLTIEKFIRADTRVRLIKNLTNLGHLPSANIALRVSRGEYVAWLSCDDVILPGFVEQTIQPLLDNPNIGLCCSDCAMIFANNPEKDPNVIYTTRLLNDAHGVQTFTPQTIIDAFRKKNFWIPGHTAIVRKSHLLKLGGFPESLGYLSDWFVWHSIALESGAVYIPKELSIWRQTSNQLTVKQRENPNVVNRCYSNIFEILKHPPYKCLHRRFRKSGLLDLYARKVVGELWGQWRYWDFIARLAKKYILFRWNKYIKRAG